ncbi:hypothetical protein PRK78_007396 [Emydomyces testavorans]|uniref:Rhodopsin domain-containing protein n=1 Tax=Emydomyces testavorans TaxID=2070801 RepID=A0AAF0DP84_9EURO|nr:hypothetical protein PRK78_007396 [Emydomyces testavorans]
MDIIHNNPVSSNNINRPAFMVSIWVFFGVTTLLLACRFGIRLWLHRKLFWDDILAGIAYLFLLTHDILATLVAPAVYLLLDVSNGGPIPSDFIEKADYLVRMLFASNIMFILCLYLVKASLLALLWRLFRNLPSFRRAWWALLGLTVISATITIVLAPIACSKLTAFGCVAPKNIKRDLTAVRFTAAADILTDLMLMALPTAFILSSRLALIQKLGLVGLFMLGFTVISMSILRIIATDSPEKHPPPSWLLFWSAMETSVAVMTSCVASFKSIFTIRKRPSAYNGSSDIPGKSSRNRSEGDVNIALRSRNRINQLSSTSKNNANTVVISSEANSDRWNDGGSREQILQRTEFEVRYENASTPPLGSTASIPRQ